VACSIQHKYGGPWDVCAPQAILKAMGGRLTDLFGESILIYNSDAPGNCNERGFIATGPGSDHDALSEALLDMQVIREYQKQIMRDKNLQNAE
jgi:3'-phosphoadenosine 5'-phosphosulfate (PAPS) 3'-phosphatase